MGFVSYLEDIVKQADEYEHYLQQFNQTSDKKVDIQAILGFRKDCIKLLKVMGEIDDSDKIINNLIKAEADNRILKKENQRLKPIEDNYKKDIRNFEKRIQDLVEENQILRNSLDALELKQKNETSHREDFEASADERWRMVYQERLNLSYKELSDLKLEIYDSVEEISKMIQSNSHKLDQQTFSKLHYKLENLKIICE